MRYSSLVCLLVVIGSSGCASHRGFVGADGGLGSDSSSISGCYRLEYSVEEISGVTRSLLIELEEQGGNLEARVLNRQVGKLWGTLEEGCFALANEVLTIQGTIDRHGGLSGRFEAEWPYGSEDGDFQGLRLDADQAAEACESVVIYTLRTLTTCNEQYRSRLGEYSPSIEAFVYQTYFGPEFVPTLEDLESRAGYRYEYSRDAPQGYSILAHPDRSGRHYFVDESGVIRFEENRLPGTWSAPLP